MVSYYAHSLTEHHARYIFCPINWTGPKTEQRPPKGAPLKLRNRDLLAEIDVLDDRLFLFVFEVHAHGQDNDVHP